MYNEMPRPTQNEVDDLKAQYAREAADRWGNTEAFLESREKHAGYTPEQEKQIHREMEDIFRSFGRCTDPAAPEAQELVRRWQAHITRYHYHRMTENLDRYGPDTAQLIHDAILIFCGP